MFNAVPGTRGSAGIEAAYAVRPQPVAPTRPEPKVEQAGESKLEDQFGHTESFRRHPVVQIIDDSADTYEEMIAQQEELRKQEAARLEAEQARRAAREAAQAELAGRGSDDVEAAPEPRSDEDRMQDSYEKPATHDEDAEFYYSFSAGRSDAGGEQQRTRGENLNDRGLANPYSRFRDYSSLDVYV